MIGVAAEAAPLPMLVTTVAKVDVVESLCAVRKTSTPPEELPGGFVSEPTGADLCKGAGAGIGGCVIGGIGSGSASTVTAADCADVKLREDFGLEFPGTELFPIGSGVNLGTGVLGAAGGSLGGGVQISLRHISARLRNVGMPARFVVPGKAEAPTAEFSLGTTLCTVALEITIPLRTLGSPHAG